MRLPIAIVLASAFLAGCQTPANVYTVVAVPEAGIKVVERSIDRTELYVADEVLMCGTGAQVSPVIEVDRRRVGAGVPGPITTLLKDRYFDIVRGNVPAYAHWLTPVYPR